MDESHFSKSIIYFLLISVVSIATLINIEIQRAILPKFISASYKDNLTLQFNSIYLKSLFSFLMKIFFEKPSVVTLLVGDLPIYDNKKKGNIWQKYGNNSEQTLIKNIINKNNYTKISMLNKNTYHLFPNHNKTKMNVISFSLEEKVNNGNDELNICFIKLSTISLYEIPIDNFIINFQDEYKLESAFFKLKWKLNIPGIITKYVFSSDYEYLALVYKIVYNGIEVKYKIVYIKINGNNNDELNYDTIDLDGNVKIMALAVTKNLIVYSRKIDKFKFNFLFKIENETSSEWIRFSKSKIKFEEEPYNIISDLKFIQMNNNLTSNNNEIILFVKGIYCDISGIKMYMNLINIDLNSMNNISSIKNSSEINLFKDSKNLLNLYIDPYYYEGEGFNIYDYNYTYNISNLEIDKLNERFKKLNSPLVFNKYVQKGEYSNFLHLQFLSNVTYKILYMNNTYLSNYTNIYNTEEYIRKRNNKEISKICGNEYFVVEFKNNILSFFTSNRSDNDNSDDNLFFENPRRISFISLPKNFKFTKIYDYYFDKFNGKLILMLLIDDGVIVSLDFSGSIYQKNVGATFYRDKFDFNKTTLLFINCLFIFLYFLDWSLVDKMSIDLRNFIVDIIYSFSRYIWNFIHENNINNLNIRENNLLILSNSNFSLNSNNSNEENIFDDEYNSSNSITNVRLSRRNNNVQTNIFEDVIENIPCI